jgi:hypothetical protein
VAGRQKKVILRDCSLGGSIALAYGHMSGNQDVS